MKNPFYEFGSKIPIKERSQVEWEAFIRNKFEETGLEIADDTIKSIIEKSGGHLHFTPYFASEVWQLVFKGFSQEDPGFTAAWMDQIIKAQTILFENLFDQLNQNQRNALMAIALLEPGEKLFSEQCRKRYHLPISSTLTTALYSLVKKGLINKENGNYSILNPVFKEWLLQL